MKILQNLILINIFTSTFCIVNSFQLHDHLTKEQIQRFFNFGDETVPEHDVVSVYHTFYDTHRKNSHSIQLKPFGKDIQLYLSPREGVLAGKNMPIWTAKHSNSAPLKIEYKLLSGIQKYHIFEDINNLAVICVTINEHDKPLLEGTIGNGLRISPLPSIIHDDVLNNRFHHLTKVLYNNNQTIDDNQTFHHIVYKIKQPNNAIDNKAKREKGYKSFMRSKRDLRYKRSIMGNQNMMNYFSHEIIHGFDEWQSIADITNKIAYPEILVIVDYDEYLAIGPNFEDVIKYILTFWNAVDLRFRRFNDPKIRLNIVGIVISIDPEAMYYINKSKVGKNLVDIDKALDLKGEYFEKEKMFILEKNYDLVATMTRLTLCSYDKLQPTYCDPSPLGYSYEAGACIRVEDQHKSFVESILLIEDNGGFSGIIPTAHEVGHLLGASHDPTGTECYHGYIMTGQYLMAENNFEWSQCSIKSIQDYLRLPQASCLFNKPDEDKVYPRLLPGQLYSLEEQCRIALNSTPCYYDERVCIQLQCTIPNTGGLCYAKSSAAEGSVCGKNKMCINGQCINEKFKNEIEVTSFKQKVRFT